MSKIIVKEESVLSNYFFFHFSFFFDLFSLCSRPERFVIDRLRAEY